MANILIVGCGSIGTPLGQTLAAQGHQVTGLKRQPRETVDGIRYFAADITEAGALKTLKNDFDLLFFIVSPDGRAEPCYRAVYETGLNHVLDAFSNLPLIFVSSTGVYGQTGGEWVDESSEANPPAFNGRLLREAEQRVIAACPDSIVVRFSGIYGPGREHLLKRATEAPEIQKTPPYYTNRIHQDDCVGVLAFLLARRLKGSALEPCYLASDDAPAPLWDVVSWLAERQQCPPPAIKPAADDAPMNKRCRNARLKELGYCFRYPDYRAGYGELLTRT